MAIDSKVSLDPFETLEVIRQGIVEDSITGELIDSYIVRGSSGIICIVAVFEKHYYRAGNRLTLTVTIDNMDNYTRVHCISAGGGEGLFKFDWGASERFEVCVEDALNKYMI